ncbi:hypothetical protein [Paenibacillus andongensis]|uniref:hypothetical protein n=1 Tax=Paenibacillus andongensis TaxID=2975482 RepID=UPI0021BB9BA0|nr:hypothetical protein [Paenibacillus andongensis]
MTSLISYFLIGLMVVIFALGIYFIVTPYHHAKKMAENIRKKLIGLQKEESSIERFHQFDTWLKSEKGNKYIDHTVLPAWNSFRAKFMQYQQNGVAITPDVLDFFQEERFIHRFGQRKLVETLPGVFLALGIIGTFLGIAMGVSGLDPSGDSTVLKGGIGILLAGMKAKFASSIVGILVSLIWQGLDKLYFYHWLTNSFYTIRDTLDETFPTQEESTVLFRMLNNQEKHMMDFQVFMSEQLIPQMMSGFTNALDQSLTPHLEQTQVMMKEMLQTASANQMQGMGDMVDAFVTQLNQITGDHMKDLGEALRTTIEWQQRVHEEMGALVQSMQDSAKEQSLMVEKTTVLTDHIHQYTSQITEHQDVLERTVAQLNQTAERNTELHEATSGLLGRMIEERNVFHNHFDESISMLQQNVTSIVQQTQLQVELQYKLEQNLKGMTDTTQSQELLAATMADYATHTQRSSETLANLVESVENNAKTFTELQETMGGVLKQTESERKRMDQVLQDVINRLSGQLDEMDTRVETMKEHWDSTSDVMTKMNNQLTKSMGQFTDDMHRGLKHTFEMFDEELGTTVNLLHRVVQAIQDSLVELPDEMQTLKQTVQELNKQSKRMINPA